MNAQNRTYKLCTSISALSITAVLFPFLLQVCGLSGCASNTPADEARAQAQTAPAAEAVQPVSVQAQTPVQPASDLKEYKPTGNPMFSHKFTADPAPVVIGDTLWLITSHDETAPNGRLNRNFRMRDWCLFSTKDMKTWTEYPTPLSVDEFKWDGTHTAYAAQMIPRDGKYYLYISTNGNGIGVAVADRPEGPYKDPIGKQLVTPAQCFATTHSWACIDPTVMIDDDGQAWLVWGNRKCYYAKLKKNMVELDGPVKTLDIDLKDMPFEEGPWIFKHNGRYYLVYACGNPEKLAYAIGDRVDGHFEAKGILMERSGNCGSNHPGVANFNGEWYLFYHTGANGGDFNRAVCVDRMTFNADGTINPVPFSKDGIFGAEQPKK